MKDAISTYKQLLADAAMLRKYADPNASAVPTFWNEMRKATAAALLSHDAVANGPLSGEQMSAIAWAADLSPLWLGAAALLETRAANMLDALRKQADEASALADALVGAGT